MFGEDEITDRSQRFLAGELVREQLMRQLGEELPYATTVEIERFTEDGNLLRIGAVIWVEREGQKAIVIGKGGTRLKEIGAKPACRWSVCSGPRCSWKPGCACAKAGPTTRLR
jgi:GTP-binding protein Era